MNFIDNYYYELPNDIILHIQYLLKIYNAAYTIKRCLNKYYTHKCFIINSILNLPKYNSLIDNSLVIDPSSIQTYFYFKILRRLTTGNESYFNIIHCAYYLLALSIDESDWVYAHQNIYTSYNKFNCLTFSIKYQIDEIIRLIV